MRKGSKHTPEARQKISVAKIGKRLGYKPTPETRQKISEARKGKTLSEEHKQHISEAKKGKRLGKESPHWKGGRSISSRGYVLIRIDGKYVLEHRIVMSQYLGRPLTSEEVAHHKNGIRADNRLENLKLMTAGEHAKYHRLEK